MGALTKEGIDELLREARVGVLGINRRDRSPQLVPVWFVHEDGALWMMSAKRSAKVDNIRKDPKVSLCVDDEALPYKGAVIYGRALLTEEDLQARRRAIARKYLGEERGDRYVQGPRPGGSTLIRLTPERIHSWDYGLGDRQG